MGRDMVAAARVEKQTADSSHVFEDIHTCQNNLINELKFIFLAGVSRTVAQNSYDSVALCLRNTKCFYWANFASRA